MSANGPLDCQLDNVYGSNQGYLNVNYKDMKTVYKNFENIVVGEVDGKPIKVSDLIEYSQEQKSGWGKMWQLIRILVPGVITHANVEKVTENLHPSSLIRIQQIADRINYNLVKDEQSLNYGEDYKNLKSDVSVPERKIVKNELKALTSLNEFILSKEEAKINKNEVNFFTFKERREILEKFSSAIDYFKKKPENERDEFVDNAYKKFAGSDIKNMPMAPEMFDRLCFVIADGALDKDFRRNIFNKLVEGYAHRAEHGKQKRKTLTLFGRLSIYLGTE